MVFYNHILDLFLGPYTKPPIFDYVRSLHEQNTEEDRDEFDSAHEIEIAFVYSKLDHSNISFFFSHKSMFFLVFPEKPKKDQIKPKKFN
jgi:hypothetical protein